MGKYATFNNKNYPVNIRNDKYRLKSKEHESGFKELIDLGGNIHPDIWDVEHSLNGGCAEKNLIFLCPES
ncbi:hypothetical protein [Psychrobacillus psychrodurans]|uniref:Uncharacterized protein n=1 Tax=Psychrobacillus psychrodurans TaxID=126157 RepID=A0A9X3RBD3_9BACI|nr:hypothetical protein [Psychrobacillus psychrodurans]MCZ8535485.1 hypothetical protein [Psychrobacillus psychrodurans]